ncbi:YbaB/EbfC family nucleoid-associated protein, partial [Dysosmobacter welbionis]
HGAHQRLPVDAQAQGPAGGAVLKGGAGGVEAQELKHCGIRILIADVAGGGDGLRADQVGSNQLHLVGGELVQYGLPVPGGGEGDPLRGAGLSPPPAAVGRQTGTRFIGGEIVGAGAHRGEAFL